MNWDAIGAIGQVLGSIAVFVRLGYLAVQVRYARSETRRALSQGRGEAIRGVNSLFMDERVSSAWLKSMITLETPVTPVMAALMERAKRPNRIFCEFQKTGSHPDIVRCVEGVLAQPR